MSTTEKTVEEKLRALYDLQIIHSRLDEIRNTRGELPMEVEDLENEIAGLEKRSSKFTDEIELLNKEIKIKEEEIAHSQSLIQRYTKQLDNVRNDREHNSLSKEIEYQELEIQLAEKRIKEFKAKIEQKQEVVDELTEKIQKLKEHLTFKKSELEQLIKETEKEEAFLNKKAEEFSKLIDERLLASYYHIRNNSKNGLAIVSVERGAAVGSYFTIPPQKVVELSMRKKIITDEHSGKILVDQALANEEAEKMAAILKG